MRPLNAFLISLAVITVAMSPLLGPLLTFSFSSELYSHLLLIPCVSIYLGWHKRRLLLQPTSAPLRGLALLPLAMAGVAIAVRLTRADLAVVDAMSLSALAYVMLIWATALMILDRAVVRALIFPLGFLLAMVPFPVFVESAIEHFLQHGSAECAYWMFRISGISVLRNELIFHLPSISMQVAPECSGIRSSLVLLITSIVGGYLFLESPWRRVILVLSVIPLALVRNGFRVFVLGELCERIGPHMINSRIHHQGGPIFFALSLIPFLGIVWLLMRSEKRSHRLQGKASEVKYQESTVGNQK